MSGYIITEDFIELKRLYEEGNIDKFENKKISYSKISEAVSKYKSGKDSDWQKKRECRLWN